MRLDLGALHGNGGASGRDDNEKANLQGLLFFHSAKPFAQDAANAAEAGGSGGTGLETPRVRASQAIHVTLGVFLGAFIGSVGFARRMLRALPPGFPSHGVHSARLCSALAWVEPPRRAA